MRIPVPTGTGTSGATSESGVYAGVPVPDRPAVLREPVVVRKRQLPVLARVEELHPLEQVAVGLHHVHVVLVRMAELHVAEPQAVGAVGAEPDVLLRADAVG